MTPNGRRGPRSGLRSRSFVLGLALTLHAVLLWGCGGASPPDDDGAGSTDGDAGTEPVRVVVITLDTLRYDRLAGSDTLPTRMPRLLERAGRGLRFVRFMASSPLTQPTHATLFTARHPWQHRVTRNGLVLGDAAVTLAEVMQQAGYETRAVVASFPVSSRFGFAQGFDAFDEDFSESLFERQRWEGEWDVPDREFFALGENVTDRAIASLEAASGSRQFYWFHYFDPHAPYGVSVGAKVDKREIMRRVLGAGEPAARVLEEARALYDADVESLDRALERLLERLDRDADRFETHVLITADHGESFGEEGALGHGSRLSLEQLHVPALLLSPAVEPAQRTDVAGTIDLMPTLLGLLGIEPPTGTRGDGGRVGRNLLEPATAPTLAFGMRRTLRAGQSGEVKLLDGSVYELVPIWFYAAGPDGQLRVGNSRDVPAVAPAPGAELGNLEALFALFERELGDPSSGDPLDPDVRRALEALGYVD